MRVLLDTSIFVRAAVDGVAAMPSRVAQVLKAPSSVRLLSSISVTEIAIKHAISKIHFPPAEVERIAQDIRLTIIPYTARHARSFSGLPFFSDHRDPMDRMLIATAICEQIPIISSDRHFKRYPGLEVLWN